MSGYKLQDNEVQFQLNTPTKDSETFISCILSKPEKSSPITNRAAILMHGIGAHKNSCYMSKLARKLSKEQGIYVIRFDFRNCGDSSKTGSKGRTLNDDIDDLSVVYEWLNNFENINGEKLFVDTLVGHSRGVVDVLNWQLHNKDKFISNLGLCAGRFIGSGLLESIKVKNPDVEKTGGHYIKGFQDGCYKDVWVPLEETLSLSELYMDTVKEITKDTDTLTVYGSRENVIPITDCANYVNNLKDRNTLILIPDGDHCYKGVDKIPESEWENSTIPIDKKLGVCDYNYQVADEIAKWMSEDSMNKRFYEKNLMIGEFTPRWKKIEGVGNFRDLGGWKCKSGERVKIGKVFRSGKLSNITEDGIKELKKLGIKKVFDLRLPIEQKMSDKTEESNWTIESDVEVIKLIEKDDMESFDGVNMLLNLIKLSFDWNNTVDKYKSTLENTIPQTKEIFYTLRDEPNTKILIHCGGGKDRTGLVSMILLLILGVEPLIVVQEYALSQQSIKEINNTRNKSEKLIDFIESSTTTVEFIEKNKPYDSWQYKVEGIDALSDVHSNVCLSTISYLIKEYGSIENYLRVKMGITEEDISIIRANLLQEESVFCRSLTEKC